MARPKRTRLDDPTAERTADPVPARSLGGEDCVRRRADERDFTPRRYEQPAEEDDPVMPGDDSSLTTKI